jgi:hypothetical protein
MTDLASSTSKVQLEETQYLDSLGRETYQKVGRNINQLIDDAVSPLLGEVKISVLDETTFQERRGTGWVVMKGQDIAGSDYASTLNTITGSTSLPDSRGLFMRVLDNGAGVDTGRAIATTQADDNGTHRHPVSRFQVSTDGDLKNLDNAGIWDQSGLQDIINIRGASLVNPTAGKSGTQGDELRPKNIAVNFFIRINE